MDSDAEKRNDAIKALINLALLEAFALAVVVAIFLTTQNLTYLLGGVAGCVLIFGPLFFRWHKEHGGALKAPPRAKGDR